MILIAALVSAASGQEAPAAITGQPAPSVQSPAEAKPESPAAPVQVAATSANAPYGEISGLVKSGNVPLPGVAVSAANTLTGKKYSTSTDVDGTFRIAVTGKGRYVVRAEFSAFAPMTQEVLINDQNRDGKADLAMVLLSRAQKDAQQEQRQQIAQQLGGRASMQQLALSGGGDSGGPTGGSDPAALAGAGLPNAGLAAEGGN
ncbi:MAG TPA: carboxypeptidase regulatory-like domain-containing protein, partial [Candidatus Angelobacter sp.]|nr:carboxypeptidase regulatory-like domain-containing protein [Candidatus Angelobacter sp.]